MNYLAHGFRFVDRPYFLAGAALPDWLSVVDRRCRVRTKHVLPCCDGEDAALAEFARGVAQHHFDDGWFHETQAFYDLSWQLTCAFRERLNPDDGMRPSFLGHIVVELLLDAALHEQSPGLLDGYYDALDVVDPAEIEAWVAQLAPRPATDLGRFIDLFRQSRFLYDYADDAKLCYRLNQVMRRVGLPELPETMCEVLAPARAAVAARVPELLAGAPTPIHGEELTR